eukprot:1811556-Rhodomonas_salina.2
MSCLRDLWTDFLAVRFPVTSRMLLGHVLRPAGTYCVARAVTSRSCLEHVTCAPRSRPSAGLRQRVVYASCGAEIAHGATRVREANKEDDKKVGPPPYPLRDARYWHSLWCCRPMRWAILIWRMVLSPVLRYYALYGTELGYAATLCAVLDYAATLYVDDDGDGVADVDQVVASPLPD